MTVWSSPRIAAIIDSIRAVGRVLLGPPAPRVALVYTNVHRQIKKAGEASPYA